MKKVVYQTQSPLESKLKQVSSAILVSVLSMSAIALWCIGIWRLFSWNNAKSISEIFTVCLLFVVSFLLILITRCVLNSLLLWVKFSESGVIVKFALKNPNMIPWNNFEEVCIIHRKFGNKEETGVVFSRICFVKKGSTKDCLGRWKIDYPFCRKNFILVRYSEELFQGIKNVCPIEIVDLRNTAQYRYHTRYT